MRIRTRLFSDDRMGWLDYLLAALAGIMATFSVGMALLRPSLGLFFVSGVAIGMTFSYIVQRKFREQRWIEVGGFLYFLAAMVAVFYSRGLNALLPEGGFTERELTVASVLAWMILFGSFVSWKDSTLLFQAVPSIALFGLVGAFNTFEGSTVAFFIFLLCLATLFARAHARSMIKLALESGFSRVDRIRQGPWRWMAGPEWALASAAVVVLISVFGAPILQESVKGVSGLVRIPLPPLPRNRANPVASILPGSSGASAMTVPVGTGPFSVMNRVVFKAKLDQPRYLRSGSYSTYENGSWNKVPINEAVVRQVFNETMAMRDELLKGPNFERLPFQIEFEGAALSTLPAPGEVLSVGTSGFSILLDGAVGLDRLVPLNASFAGEAAVLKEGVKPENVPEPLPEVLWRYVPTSTRTERLNVLADEVTATALTDYDKALAIKREIERRCKYNLNAEAAPRGVDPVENFLFGEKREGYCDLFASAMVLMARYQGIPARYVRGYYPLNEDTNNDGWYEVTENCAHAWAELYFEGLGWVVFDATEGAEEVPGGGRGATNDTTPFYKRAWFGWFLNGVIGLSVLAAGGIALRGARRIRLAIDWDEIEMARNYEHFTAALQRATGQPKRPSQTATEYVASVEGRLGEAHSDAMKLNDLFVLALYGPPGDGRPKAADLREPVRAFRKALRASSRRA